MWCSFSNNNTLDEVIFLDALLQLSNTQYRYSLLTLVMAEEYLIKKRTLAMEAFRNDIML